jgi:hypothetical protein
MALAGGADAEAVGASLRFLHDVGQIARHKAGRCLVETITIAHRDISSNSPSRAMSGAAPLTASIA